MKELKIEIPDGYVVDRENSTFERIVFKEIKKALPKTWEELSNNGSMQFAPVFSFEHTEAYTALSKLWRLREVYRDGWIPDWCDTFENKFAIYPCFNNWNVDWVTVSNHFLSFQSREIAEDFLFNFRDLIEQAKPLMS